MGLYAELGVRPVINACATLTRLGGSLMPPEVLEAMAEAARHFVDLQELQRRVGEEIAALTRNEAAYVSSGAAAGLTLATAACIAGTDLAAIRQLPDLTGLKDEVIIHRAHRNGYDHAVRQVGVKVVEIGSDAGTEREELERAFSEQTAAVFWFQGAMTGKSDLPLPVVIEMAKARGVPVVVDAAAQLPPVENLWRFTQMGADLAVFSGGKDLRGPQSSGLILGRRDLIAACAINGNPNHSIGRPMKVGKEEMVGLLAAVRRYVNLDHAARAQNCEQIVADWNAALNRLPGVSACRDFPNEAGQPLPRSLVTIHADAAGVNRETVMKRLESGDPAIMVSAGGADSLLLNPMTLEPGEEKIVLERLIEALTNPGE
ncbi:MAG TPA: aminotransferase class V-fold PLP-dependent enzyme [Chthonomonadaceae bacterium]|nr:aminotransferase class V-fold PLP-dependent enzyme [Chthonomonadaceae bacterium]